MEGREGGNEGGREGKREGGRQAGRREAGKTNSGEQLEYTLGYCKANT